MYGFLGSVDSGFWEFLRLYGTSVTAELITQFRTEACFRQGKTWGGGGNRCGFMVRI